MSTEWHVYLVDDGERHWYAGPDASTVKEEACERYGVGWGQDEEVTVEQVSPSSYLTFVEDGDMDDAVRDHEGLDGAKIDTTPGMTPRIGALASAWAEHARTKWSREGRPVCLGSSVY